MAKKKILCIGDSTALPGHLNKYEDTWYSKLYEHFDHLNFITVFRRSITTEILVTEGGGDLLDCTPLGADCLEYYEPEAVILQLGIVDCAPRLFLRGTIEYKVVNSLPEGIRLKYIKLIKKIRTRNLNRVEVPLKIFKKNLTSYFDRCLKLSVRKVVIVGIPYPDQRMIEANPMITTTVETYNNCYRELCVVYDFATVIFPLDSRELEDIFQDGYHPNIKGHQLLFEAIKAALGSI
jgi:lysophospholipase L1-like esterase